MELETQRRPGGDDPFPSRIVAGMSMLILVVLKNVLEDVSSDGA